MNVKKGQQKRAKKRRFSKTARAVIWKHSGGMCEQPDCHATDNLTFDHIIPLSKGGANHSSNGQVLCLIHNQKKGANI
jgi:5-methylcytosine-specific restriction endonuclease McrA